MAGSSISQDANQRADGTMNQQVTYANAAQKGPRIIVLPGQIKSNNATFLHHISVNNIADFADLVIWKKQRTHRV